MEWKVEFRQKEAKRLLTLPKNIQKRMRALTEELRYHGPVPSKLWNNFSKLGQDKYHCHLTYHYVACWEVIDKKIRIMEVYYVGSRENAPY